tara:strand:- start:675 stop:1250 length:576 start_codon:yes stop_codon:yes gene_type:complete
MYDRLNERIINLEKQNKRYRNIFVLCAVLVCSAFSYAAYDEAQYDRLRVKQLVVEEYILGVRQGKPAYWISSDEKGHGNIEFFAPPFFEEDQPIVMVKVGASENGPYLYMGGYDNKTIIALEQASYPDGHNSGAISVFNNKDKSVSQIFTDTDGGKLFIANSKGPDGNGQGAVDIYVDEMGIGHIFTNETK